MDFIPIDVQMDDYYRVVAPLNFLPGLLIGLWNRLALSWNQSLSALVSAIWIPICWVLRIVWATARLACRRWKLTLFLGTLSTIVYVCLRVVFWVLDWIDWIQSLHPHDFARVAYKFTHPYGPEEVYLKVPPEVKHSLISPAMYNAMILFQFVIIVFLVIKPRRVERVCEHGFKVEAARAGSALINSTPPEFLAEVWIKHSTFTPSRREGVCFRVGSHVYLPKHLIIGAQRMWLKFKNNFLEVDLDCMVEVDFDVIRFPYELVSKFQMGSGKFVKHFSPHYVHVHNGDLTSMGRLTRHDVVGHVEYDGSTLPSFSGSPYYLNKAIFGMHIGSGVLNTGICSTFLHHVETTIRPESDSFTTDVDELYEEVRRQGGEVKYRRMANDYYVVEVQGKYITYSEEEFDNAMSKHRAAVRETKVPRYRPEGLTAAELASLGVNLERSAPTAAAKPKAQELKSTIEEEPCQDIDPVFTKPIPEGVASFTNQDSENCQWPVASATLAAGPSIAGDGFVLLPQKSSSPPTDSPLTQPQPKRTAGQRKMIVRQNVHSAITYDTLKLWLTLCEQLERDGITPNKEELNVLREMWFSGPSARVNEQE